MLISDLGKVMLISELGKMILVIELGKVHDADKNIVERS